MMWCDHKKLSKNCHVVTAIPTGYQKHGPGLWSPRGVFFCFLPSSAKDQYLVFVYHGVLEARPGEISQLLSWAFLSHARNRKGFCFFSSCTEDINLLVT